MTGRGRRRLGSGGHSASKARGGTLGSPEGGAAPALSAPNLAGSEMAPPTWETLIMVRSRSGSATPIWGARSRLRTVLDPTENAPGEHCPGPSC